MKNYLAIGLTKKEILELAKRIKKHPEGLCLGTKTLEKRLIDNQRNA